MPTKTNTKITRTAITTIQMRSMGGQCRATPAAVCLQGGQNDVMISEGRFGAAITCMDGRIRPGPSTR